MTDQALVDLAFQMLERSYVPYSKFPVGAAIECADGTVFTGCNIENAAYGSTICAERTAIYKAVSEGKRVFTAIAIAGGPEGSAPALTAPCGVCRQVMREFCDPEEFRIILGAGTGEKQVYLLKELLPLSFGPGNLNGKEKHS